MVLFIKQDKWHVYQHNTDAQKMHHFHYYDTMQSKASKLQVRLETFADSIPKNL